MNLAIFHTELGDLQSDMSFSWDDPDSRWITQDQQEALAVLEQVENFHGGIASIVDPDHSNAIAYYRTHGWCDRSQ